MSKLKSQYGPRFASPVALADQLCTAVLEVRQFGEVNSPYLTRLINEMRTKGWRTGAKRKAKIESELRSRAQQIQGLVLRIEAVLVDFGRLYPLEDRLLKKYWDEADNVQRLYMDGTIQLERMLDFHIYTRKPFSAPLSLGSL